MFQITYIFTKIIVQIGKLLFETSGILSFITRKVDLHMIFLLFFYLDLQNAVRRGSFTDGHNRAKPKSRTKLGFQTNVSNTPSLTKTINIVLSFKFFIQSSIFFLALSDLPTSFTVILLFAVQYLKFKLLPAYCAKN